jgi:hypothetical protein
MLIVHRAIEVVRGGSAEVVEEGAPISVMVSDSCEAKYEALYGEILDASLLGNVKLLGSLSRGINTRNLPTVDLAKVFSQCEDKSTSEESFVFDGQGNLKKKQRTSRMGSHAAFLARLNLFMSSLVFVSVMAPAPAEKWSGDPNEGVIKGKRYQLTRLGAQRYVSFWTETVMHKGAETIDKVIALEKDMRSKWVDPFRRYRSLQCCILDSIRDYQGVVFARLAFQRPQPLSPKTGAKNGPKDFSKLPGFDPDQPTARVTAGGKQVCKHFNVEKGCNFGPNCKFEHVCDVRGQNGKACGSKTHIRIGHKRAMQEAAAAGPAGGRAEED